MLTTPDPDYVQVRDQGHAAGRRAVDLFLGETRMPSEADIGRRRLTAIMKFHGQR